MNNNFISKYMDIDSFVHKLDPRTKLVFSSLYFVLVFLAKTPIDFTVLITILFLAKHYSKTPLFYMLSSFKLISFIIIFSSLVHIFFNKDGSIILSVFSFKLYSGAIFSIVLLSLRFFLVVSLMTIFMMSTSPNSITSAIEKSFSFLNKFGVKVGAFALLMSISLRFIPTIGEETARIIKAQTSRGANFTKGGLISKVKSFVPILIPIFISTLKRADELATAMEVRAYDPDKIRSRYKILKYGKSDYIIYLIILIISLLIVLK